MRINSISYKNGIIDALEHLGRAFAEPDKQMLQVFQVAESHNTWFAHREISRAIQSWADTLTPVAIKQWLKNELFKTSDTVVLVIGAGNIPLVVLHDILCVLVSGKKLLLKPSHDDRFLPVMVVELLQKHFPFLNHRIAISDKPGGKFDAAIATGSNNSKKYFEYYFKKIPSLLRGHRISAAVLTGEESSDELEMLGRDVFSYFGLGCRNVSHLWVPEGYDVQKLFRSWFSYGYVLQSHRYSNNYQYHHTLMLLNNVLFLDNGFVILQQNQQLRSAIGVVHYSYYSDETQLQQLIAQNKNDLQCVAGRSFIPFGQTQSPALWDYPDNVDTLEFLRQIP